MWKLHWIHPWISATRALRWHLEVVAACDIVKQICQSFISPTTYFYITHQPSTPLSTIDDPPDKDHLQQITSIQDGRPHSSDVCIP